VSKEDPQRPQYDSVLRVLRAIRDSTHSAPNTERALRPVEWIAMREEARLAPDTEAMREILERYIGRAPDRAASASEQLGDLLLRRGFGDDWNVERFTEADEFYAEAMRLVRAEVGDEASLKNGNYLHLLYERLDGLRRMKRAEGMEPLLHEYFLAASDPDVAERFSLRDAGHRKLVQDCRDILLRQDPGAAAGLQAAVMNAQHASNAETEAATEARRERSIKASYIVITAVALICGLAFYGWRRFVR